MASGRFVTFCYARIDGRRDADRLRECRAQPAAADPRRRCRRAPRPTAAWCWASSPTIRYEQAALALAAGDRLLFYTDGITEARNAAGDEYEEGRLAAIATASRALPVEEMKDAILADVNGFTGGQFEDDATLIVVGIP